MIDDDDDFRRANYERMFGTTAEREAEAREMAERQRQIDGERILREAWAAKEAREARAATVVTRSAPVTQYRAAAAATTDWDAWRKFIIATVDKKFINDKMLEKVVKAVREYVEEGDISVCTATKEAREKALEPLRAEIAQLRVEIAELRGAAAVQRSQPMSVADERRRAGALTRARQEIEQLRAAMKCDGTPQGFNLDQLRPFEAWRH